MFPDAQGSQSHEASVSQLQETGVQKGVFGA